MKNKKKYYFDVIYYLFILIMMTVIVYLGLRYYNYNFKRIKKVEKVIKYIEQNITIPEVITDYIFKIRYNPNEPNQIQPITTESVNNIKSDTISTQIKNKKEVNSATEEEFNKIEKTLVKIKSKNQEFSAIPINKNYLIFFNSALENEFLKINNLNFEYEIFTDRLNFITVLKLFGYADFLSDKIKLYSGEIKLNDDVYVFNINYNDKTFIKSSIISMNNNFDNYKYSGLYRLSGYFDKDYFGSYIFNKNFELIGISVYVNLNKSNNLYFIGIERIKKYMNILDAKREELKYFNIDMKLDEEENGIRVIESKNNNFQRNDLIIGINNYPVRRLNEFYHLVYTGLIEQKMMININRNKTEIQKIILADENLSYFEKKIGIYLKNTKYGLNIIGAEKGNNFLKSKGLNIGDALISVNNFTLNNCFDLYLIKDIFYSKDEKKTVLFRTVKNTYIFFDL